MTPARHVRASVTDDGLILLDTESGAIFSANAVGARIWQLLQDGRSAQDIVDDVAQACAVAPDTVAGDMAQFLDDLRARALIVD